MSARATDPPGRPSGPAASQPCGVAVPVRPGVESLDVLALLRPGDRRTTGVAKQVAALMATGPSGSLHMPRPSWTA